MKATVGYVENISIEVDAKPAEWALLYEALRAGRKTKAQKATLFHFANIIEPYVADQIAPELDGTEAD